MRKRPGRPAGAFFLPSATDPCWRLNLPPLYETKVARAEMGDAIGAIAPSPRPSLLQARFPGPVLTVGAMADAFPDTRVRKTSTQRVDRV